MRKIDERSFGVGSLREKSYKILLKSYKIINDGYFKSRFPEIKEIAERASWEKLAMLGVFVGHTESTEITEMSFLGEAAMRGGIV